MEHEARLWIAACKVRCAQINQQVNYKAMHLLGSLGMSNETVLPYLMHGSYVMGIADGPTEVHQLQIGRTLLKEVEPAPGRFPTEHIPSQKPAAEEWYARTVAMAPEPA
jgi:acyl-CoA dehydrogenase